MNQVMALQSWTIRCMYLQIWSHMLPYSECKFSGIWLTTQENSSQLLHEVELWVEEIGKDAIISRCPINISAMDFKVLKSTIAAEVTQVAGCKHLYCKQ